MLFRVLFRAAALFALLVSACVGNYFTFRSHAANPATEAKHGLTGSYYVANLGWENDVPPGPRPVYWSQVWTNNNDFKLPRTFTAPAASRVDPQIAFGQGKGFSAKPNSPRVIWWPTGLTVPAIWQGNELAAGGIYLAAVIWKGYIHLPKAGTYYFGTVSNAPSAVYLNQARVALNGNYAPGVLVADAFSYAKEEVQDFVQNFSYGHEEVAFRPHAQDKYVVPVPIDGPRDLPIEVQYNSSEMGTGNPLGIDLFWVTPDAPRDVNGKPIAKIVPSEALYTEPPGTIEKPAVRSANSTIEADHLYFPTEYVEGAVNLTIRLADKDGNPIAGKRVHVNSLISYGQADSIVQPDKPTDEKGETTAKIRPYKVEHDSTIFATDVTDLVDLAQVAHVTFQQVDWNFFEPFSPYYDQGFLLTPNPPVVGKPTLIKTALKNHSKFPATVRVTFLTTDANIGATGWAEIAQVKDLELQPGKSKEVSTTFTPKEVMSHKCYRVEVEGRYIAMNPSDRKVFAAALLPPMLANPPDQVAKGAQQINTATVAHCTPAGMALYTLLGGGIADFCFGGPCPPGSGVEYLLSEPLDKPEEARIVPHCLGGGGGKILTKRLPPLHLHKLGPGLTKGNKSEAPASVPPLDAGKNTAALGAGGSAANCDEFLLQAQQANKAGNEAEYKAWIQIYYDCQRERGAWKGAAQDPPDPSYRRLAVAASDTPAGYIDAARISMERYRAAEEEGDVTWMSRHLTAMELYFKRIADAERRAADNEEKRAGELPAGDANALEQRQSDLAALFTRLRQSGTTPEDLKQLETLGVSQEQAEMFYGDLLSLDESPQLQGPRGTLLRSAAFRRELAEQAELVASLLPSSGPAGTVLAQSYIVGNPHEKQENIDLFIRPISIPVDWKLSIVNAMEPAVQGQKTPGDNPPKFPVREVEAGKHYAVSLPAKAEVKVASVLIPVGELGAHTTARWAVEGKIGDELIGGMVHEMNVPYIIADLQLPPVGSKDAGEELTPRSKAWARIVTEVAAAIFILGVITYLFIFSRKRRRGTTRAT